MEAEYLTVSQVNAYINKKLKYDPELKNIHVKGEISNINIYRSGHIYFTLKDESSQISAVMFKGMRRFLNFEPKDGMKVIVKGKVEVYEKNGKYQLYAARITEDGIGALYEAYEKLKNNLQKEGLFDDEHKKEIPKYPKKIGVVTAETGAAIRDIITTIKNRYPYCEILVFSTLVQGNQAAPQIVRQIKHAQQYDINTLIVGRGGGSIEDLWPFNEEVVAHAIFDSELPIISAVGHETDFTIADFVADLRAPTPSAAAELAVPNVEEILLNLEKYNTRYKNALKKKIELMRLRYEKCMANRVFKEPLQKINERYINIDMKVKQMQNSITNKVKDNKTKMVELITKLDTLSPLKTLARGYSLTMDVNGKVVNSIERIHKDDELIIRFQDGSTNVKVL